MKFFFKILFTIFILIDTSAFSIERDYFNDGVKYYEKKDYENAKFKFEQDIVFNPKNEISYLYLSKIHREKKRYKLEEIDLNTVILLNPANEDAIYSLVILNINKSNFSEAEKKIEILKTLCKKKCSDLNMLSKDINEEYFRYKNLTNSEIEKRIYAFLSAII